MKTIEVSDEMYEFLIKTRDNIKIQDNRGTASPYGYVIHTYDYIETGEGNGDKSFYYDFYDGAYQICDTEDTKALLEHCIDNYPEDMGEFADRHLLTSKQLSDCILDGDNLTCQEFLDKHIIKKVDMKKIVTSENFFLTEKGYDEHMELNGHNYKNSVEPAHSYITYLNRNPEMEKLIEFIKEIK